MRWRLLTLFCLLMTVMPTFLLSEPGRSHCPPLAQVPAAWQKRFTQQNQVDQAYVPSAGPPAITISAFYDLCGRSPEVVICAGGGSGSLTLQQVKDVDVRLRRQFEYRDDMLTHGVGDYWTPFNLCGDCEDYSLNLSQALLAAGQGGQNMGLVLWYTPAGYAHATLVVATSDAGMVEVGVGDGYPAPIDWKAGTRIAVIWMDGRREFSAPPGWPKPFVEDGAVVAPTITHVARGTR